MKKQIISIAVATLFVITGCQADNEESQQGTQNNNVQPVRFDNNPDGISNRNRSGDFTLERDLEERRNTNNLGTQNINNNNDLNNGGNNDNGDNNNNNPDQYDVAEEAAEQIAKKIDEIDNAYVLTTDNNAYVAAELDSKNGNDAGGQELTDEVKNKISDVVKSVDNNIDHVYVSTNPDFRDLTNNYVNDVNNGEPIEGFFEEMGNMVERIFPQNK